MPVPCDCSRECLECKDSNSNENCTVCDASKGYVREDTTSETSGCIAEPGCYKPEPP